MPVLVVNRAFRSTDGEIPVTENRPLGTTTKGSSTEVSRASYDSIYSLMDESQRLLSSENHRHCICHQYRIPTHDTIEIRRNLDESSAGYGGLMKCGNVWACPVCSRKISEQRRDELTRAVDTARGRGDRVVMLTLTHSHGLDDDFVQSRKTMVKAYSRLTSGRWWKEMTEYFSIYGRIRALEVTHSYKNGWHIHFHVLLFLNDTDHDIDYMESNIKGRWSGILNRIGGFASHERGATITENQSDIATYVTKFGTEYTEIGKTESPWTEAHELAKAAVKVAKDKDSRTPFSLLADSKAGDKQAGALFVQYVLGMYRQQQLVWSNGLKDDLLNEEEITDQEIADMPEQEVVATVDIRTYRAIGRMGMRGVLLDWAARGEDRKLQTVLVYMENHTWDKTLSKRKVRKVNNVQTAQHNGSLG